MSKPIDIVEMAFEAASAEWTGLDWETGDEPTPELEAAVAADAEAAESAGERARDAASQGRWADAIKEAGEAASIEREYGDAPVWGPFLAAVKVAAARASTISEGAIVPGHPCWGALFDCRYDEARTVARREFAGVELRKVLRLIDEAEEYGSEEADCQSAIDIRLGHDA